MLESRAPIALLILRLSVAIFLAVWVVEKFVAPSSMVGIGAKFYGLELTVTHVYVIGAIQAVMLLLFTIGAVPLVSTGFFVVIHAVSMLVSYENLLNPYVGPNHLFHAGIPALAALVALLMLRHWDTLASVQGIGRGGGQYGKVA
ncbi:hypothetical protein SAMN05216241_102428 [Limimonas halophila]|uniref:DoxX protein n=1 Tax=Limimonas halophila TaxID=1082479 RepID=A0A1G7P519_9PROT|nr:hypothetical protein [Limimonas halophila]SDF81197.1 hypothetical protein SAMN05216241_102428 [Limimonas halophila]